jgi:hypothetical protein
MFIVIWSSPILLSVSGIGYRRYHFFLFNVYSLHLLPMPKGIGCRRYPCVMLVAKENFLLSMPMKIGARRLRFFRVIFFHLLIPSDVEFGRIG